MNDIETHPWHPWLPERAKVLFLGTFPPGRHRWAMDFFYPNPGNDFWRIMGLLFFGERDALYDSELRTFRLEKIKSMLDGHGIALGDTVKRARRLRGNASDKYLEVVEPVDLDSLLCRMPMCRDVAATGEKAAQIVSSLTSTSLPRMGEYVSATYADGSPPLRVWRMPSTSRAYPMPLETKAGYYRTLLSVVGLIA